MSRLPSPSLPASTLPGAGVRNYQKARPLAKRLGLCAKTIHRMADAGRIQRYKLNARVVLYDVDELLALVADARTGGPPDAPPPPLAALPAGKEGRAHV